MWNALGNGAGVYGGGGYVCTARGWEFVPCSMLEPEGDRKRSGSPLRGVTSTASLGHLTEHSGFTRAASPPVDLQSQHLRLRKRFEELRRRHGQEKDSWMKEKEMLLREVADVQGGENRRILLDLKTLLEEVQSEVKREESKRSELQLQYTKDQCTWELERAELQCRIAQLETKRTLNRETGDTLRREREEERRLLADAHSATMDLRCRMEHSERDWAREKSELLERFDLERKEWESRLRDMQHKIEELYGEVKAHRQRCAVGPNDGAKNAAMRLSMRSGSTVSGTPADSSESHGSSYSEPSAWHTHSNVQRHGVQREQLKHEAVGALELSDVPHLLPSYLQAQNKDMDCLTDTKKNTMALNAALKEIARVSEELCSFQDEIRKKSDPQRRQIEPVFFPGDGTDMRVLEPGEPESNTNPWYKDHPVLDKQRRINSDDAQEKSTKTESDPELSVRRRDAPPIPFRSTSWYISSPSATNVSPSIQETQLRTPCQSPCLHRKCNSPSIVRRFEEMLQENEGKVLTDAGIVPGPVPHESKCNISCCQSRWSCDGSRFGSSKSSKYVPVQKCLSEVNIIAAETECCGKQIVGDSRRNLNDGIFLIDSLKGVTADFATPPYIASPSQRGGVPRRNETLEQKTAEFNRILFQAGMGLHCDQDTPSPDVLLDSITEDRLANAPPDVTARYPTSRTVPQVPPGSDSSHHQHDGTVRKGASGLSQHPAMKHKDSNRSCALSHSADGQPVAQLDQSLRTLRSDLGLGPSQIKRPTDQIKARPLAETKPKRSECTKREVPNARPRVLDENPWKPSTLAAYPRPLESRSNYGAIERILKSYESLGRSQRDQELPSDLGGEDDLTELLSLLEIRQRARSSERLTHTPQHQSSVHREARVTVKSKESATSIKKSFSRPARPAKRRLPSRWANRSSSTSSTSSPSPSPTSAPAVSGSQTYAYSSFHTETVIM